MQNKLLLALALLLTCASPCLANTNTLLGTSAGAGITTGTNNTLIGAQAGEDITTGTDSTAVGYNALTNVTASPNDSFGYQAGQYVTTGVGDVAVGYEALQGVSAAPITTGYNTALGYSALSQAQGSSHNNVAVGWQAGYSTTTGGDNTSVGTAAGEYVSTGSYDVAVGEGAMKGASASPLTGYFNIGIGASALAVVQGSAADDTVMGYLAGQAITTGTDNTLVGFKSGYGVTGNYNIILGEDPSSAVTSGSSNILIGNSLTEVTNTSSTQMDIGDTIYGDLEATTGGTALTIGTSSDTGVTLTVEGEGSMIVPSGTTAERPSSTANGQIRYNSTLDALEAYVNGTWGAIASGSSAAGGIYSSGQLLCGGSVPPCHSTTLSYCPYKGNLKTTAEYGTYTIPSGTAASGCLTGNLASMYIGGTSGQAAAASTLYYVYLINVSGTTYLDLETTGHATDSTTGIEVESGNSAKTLVGMIHTDSSKKVATQGDTNYAGDTNTVATWDNRQPTTTTCTITGGTNPTVTSTSEVEVSSTNRCLFVSWGDAAQFSSTQSGSISASGDSINSQIWLDSINTGVLVSALGIEDTANYNTLLVAPSTINPTEGYHYTILAAGVSAGTATFLAGLHQSILTVQ